MQIFWHYQCAFNLVQRPVVAIGNFDGVHLGHQAVIAKAAAVANSLEAPLAVMCFEPHPRRVFYPKDPPFRLISFRRRALLLESIGVDQHFLLPFNREFSLKSAETFIMEVLVRGVRASHVVVGRDFRFGYQRHGNAKTLLEHGQHLGFGVTVVTQVLDEAGCIYSSNRVRVFLRSGKPREAAEILGCPWTIESRVKAGDQRGRLLGYPTANLSLDDYLCPAFGVYAVLVAIEGSESNWMPGIANLGIRPMYQLDQPLLEVHIFDFNGDLYGRCLKVQMIDYLRGESKFNTIEELIEQMNCDSVKARLLLAN
jgi:riboflavin kinase/FMN adenylyltransferase